jgi:hypothetical protein
MLIQPDIARIVAAILADTSDNFVKGAATLIAEVKRMGSLSSLLRGSALMIDSDMRPAAWPFTEAYLLSDLVQP